MVKAMLRCPKCGGEMPPDIKDIKDCPTCALSRPKGNTGQLKKVTGKQAIVKLPTGKLSTGKLAAPENISPYLPKFLAKFHLSKVNVPAKFVLPLALIFP